MDDTTNPPVPTNGRLPGGRFGFGNKLATGNPAHRRMFALRVAVLTAVTPERLGAIVEKLAVAAEGGDLEATRILLSYTIGKPPASVTLSGPDGGPVGIDLGRLQGVIVAALRPYGAEAQIVLAKAIAEAANGGPA